MISFIANPSNKDEKLSIHSLELKSFENTASTPKTSTNNTTKIWPISNPTLNAKRLHTMLWSFEIIKRIVFAYPKPCMSPKHNANAYWILFVVWFDVCFLKFISAENTMVQGITNSTNLSSTRMISIPPRNNVMACPMVNAVTNTNTCFQCLNWYITESAAIK